MHGTHREQGRHRSSASLVGDEQQLGPAGHGGRDLAAVGLVSDDADRRDVREDLAPGGDPATSGPEALAADRVAEWSDFADGPWDVVALAPASLEVRREARITGAADPCRLEVTKRLTLGGDRRSPSLSLEILVRNSGSAHVVADLGLSWPFDLMGGGANPAAYYETTSLGGDPITTPHDGTGDLAAADVLTFGNRDAGVRVDLRLDTPGKILGTTKFTIDVSLPGMLTAIVLHPPRFGAKVASVDDGAALRPDLPHPVRPRHRILQNAGLSSPDPASYGGTCQAPSPSPAPPC